MAWWDLLDERQQRDNQRFATQQRSFFGGDSAAATPEEDDGGGFFGRALKTVTAPVRAIGDVAEGVGGFFGNMATDLYDTTKTAAKTVAGIGEGVVDDVRAKKKMSKAEEMRKKISADYAAGKLNDPAERKRRYDELKKLQGETTKILENKNLEELDPLKAGAATAETFLNVATLGIGGGLKQLGKGVVKQGAKEVAEQAAKQAVKEVAETGGKAALKTVTKNAAEGALFGGTYGALDTWKKQGSDAETKDVFKNALFGAALGGGLGGTASLLDKNVRNEVRGIPGRLAEGGRRLAADEGGYVRIPGVADDVAEAAWAPNRVFEELAPEQQQRQQLVDSIASEYNSPEQFVDDTARMAKQYDDGARGGDLITDGEGGYTRTSDHSQWYREYYAANKRKPSFAATRDAVADVLEGRGKHDMVPDEMRDVYQILKERQAGQEAMLANPDAPFIAGAVDQPQLGPADEIQQLLTGQPEGSRTSGRTRMPTGLPKGPQGTSPLAGMEPELGNLQPRYDTEEALQAALGRGEAETNPLIDYIDPRARTTPQEAAQGALPIETPPNPYEGATADLSLPALPAGQAPAPLTPGQAKRVVRAGGEAPQDILNTQRPGTRPIELPDNVESMRDVATKTTDSGNVIPVATNNAHPTNGYVEAIRAIADDDTASAFTATRTPELANETALAKRGGAKSELFKELNQNNIDLREATGRQATYMAEQKQGANTFVKKYKWNAKKDLAARQFIEAETPEARETVLVEFKKQFGDEAAEGLQLLDAQWKQEKDVLRAEANQAIERYAGPDRTIGDLGPNYLPRVYKRPGVKGFRDSVLDVVHGGLEKIGGKDGLMNLENPTGYMSKETENAGTGLRSVNQAPLNSNVAKPNTRFLSAAQKRTAEDPQGELEGALSSMMRYKDAVSRAKELTPVIAKGRSQQKVIELVNGEKGNLRQMYDAINDQLNSISGKTNSFDQKFVNTKAGNKYVRVASELQSRISRSTIVGSANSAIAQTGQLPLIFAENGPKSFTQGMGDVFRYLRAKTAPIDESALMKTRYPDVEGEFTVKALNRAGQKATDYINKPFHLIEKMSSELAWYSSYARVKAEGLTGKAAVQEADRIAARIIGERSAGARAALYESKALAPVTAYTLEVNQLYQVAKQYFKNDPKKAASLVGAIWLYNQGYKAVTGNTLNADPLQATLDAGKILTSDEYTDDEGNPIGVGERIARATGRIGGEVLDATPLGTQVAGQLYPENGLRIPFGGGERALTRADVFGDTSLGRFGAAPPIAAGVSNPLLLLGIPGMGQLQRSVEGNRAFQEGGVFANDGDAKFDIEQTPENQWRAMLLGMYGTPEGRAYLEERQRALSGRSVQ